MKPRLLIPNSQRNLHNKSLRENFVGSYASAHTGLSAVDIEIDCGPQGDDRQTLVVLSCAMSSAASLANPPVVKLGGLYPVNTYLDKAQQWWSVSSRGTVYLLFDTSEIAGRLALLNIQPGISALGFVVGVFSFKGYYRGIVRSNGGHNVLTLDLFKAEADDVVIASTSFTGGAAVAWTVGVTEDYEVDSGSTLHGSSGHEFSPTPAQPYTVTKTGGTTDDVMYVASMRKKRLKDERLLHLLHPTGGHGVAGVLDMSWRGRTSLSQVATNEYTGRYYSAGPGALDFSGAQTESVTNAAIPAQNERNGWSAEWWEYPHLLNAGTRLGGSLSSSILCGHTGLTFYASSNGGSWDMSNARSMGTDLANTWTHRAVSWTGKTDGQWFIFENGVQIDTWNTGALVPHRAFSDDMIQGGGFAVASYNGLLEDLAVWGYPRYTSAFSVPTEPITP